MFTIKFYSHDNYRVRILEAESFTILRGENGESEITMHRKNAGEDMRIDVANDPAPDGHPMRYGSAIIENSAGKTTEMIYMHPMPAPRKLKRV